MSTAQKIKNVALSLFAQYGYEAALLTDVANQVGIRKPSIYAHFKGKEELFLEVYKDVLNQHLEHLYTMLNSVQGLSVEQRLYKILFHNCEYYINKEEEVTFVKRILFFPPKGLDDRLRQRFLEAEESLSTIIKEIFSEGLQLNQIRQDKTTDELVTSFFCLMDGSFTQLFLYGPDNFSQRLDIVWEIYWSGIKQ